MTNIFLSVNDDGSDLMITLWSLLLLGLGRVTLRNMLLVCVILILKYLEISWAV